MKQNILHYKSAIQINITLGVLSRRSNTIEPQFRKCEYTITKKCEKTITKETFHEDEETEPLWEVRGRLERILFDDFTSNLVCSPNVSMFELSGLISPIPTNSELTLKYGNGKIIEIQNVRFFDYGRKFEEGCHIIEEIYFDGVMDYKNIIK